MKYKTNDEKADNFASMILESTKLFGGKDEASSIKNLVKQLFAIYKQQRRNFKSFYQHFKTCLQSKDMNWGRIVTSFKFVDEVIKSAADSVDFLQKEITFQSAILCLEDRND